MTKINLEKALQTIRFLSADGVQKANSGHTGLPMGTAALAYTLFMRHMKYNPADPKWSNRDRFVLSGGHGSMLIYSMLYLTGYDVSMEDLKQFRQWGSITPGHPEWGHTPGVETTTGPLGQGFATGVGMAIAEQHLAAIFNKPDHTVVDHFTFGIVTDGDLMEGISSEAASLAGHLRLGKLIYLYDDNQITIEGSTKITFTEDVAKRFEAYGWHVHHVADGNDVEEIDAAVEKAKKDPRPSLILCRTTIGYGLPTKANTSGIHGSPAGKEELAKAKENVGWPVEPMFYVPDEILSHFRTRLEAGKQAQEKWDSAYLGYKVAYPELAAEFERRLAGQLPKGWEKSLPVFPASEKGLASREASGKVINAISTVLPELFGGSADLASSVKTWMDKVPAFSPEMPEGRNMHFGVREISMGAIGNGLLVHGSFIPYVATFLVFSDYARGSLRVAALSKMGVIWVLTHDSIAVGEDGPTHQPIEHVMSLRLIPDLVVLRPGDANEVVESWKYALEHRDRAVALILSRQNLPTLDRKVCKPAKGVTKGAYTLYETEAGTPDIILMATGSELSLALEAGKRLEKQGRNVRVVSFPSWELFEKQSKKYQQSVLPTEVKRRVSIEAGVTTGWQKYVGSEGVTIGIDEFGKCGPGEIVLEKFGFTVDNVVKSARKLF
ncbi:MAG TPA: transketolase [Anaerolineaceae bacterium]|nr:transketolase [Anaerolineaceae bacterium]